MFLGNITLYQEWFVLFNMIIIQNKHWGDKKKIKFGSHTHLKWEGSSIMAHQFVYINISVTTIFITSIIVEDKFFKIKN
jgi:hypothetical protein